jgi:hypothetical protein
VEGDSLDCGRRLETIPATELKLVDWLTNLRLAATTVALVTGPVGATDADGLDCGDEPTLFEAATVKV